MYKYNSFIKTDQTNRHGKAAQMLYTINEHSYQCNRLQNLNNGGQVQLI